MATRSKGQPDKPEKDKAITDTQRDRMDRPQPHLDPVEGDLETIEEDLRRQEKQ